MLPLLKDIKGIHPGLVLKRALGIKKLKSIELASSIGIHKQTLSAVLNQRRGINPILSIKLSKTFNVEKDYFYLLQASYDVQKAEASIISKYPNLNKIRPILFWDTDFKKLDWVKNKRAIIKRVLERGNDIEIKEIILFYGKGEIKNQIKTAESRLASFEENCKRFNLI